MAQPVKTPRPLPKPPDSLLIGVKTDHPNLKGEAILTARRIIKSLEGSARGFDRQNHLITQRITLIQYVEDNQLNTELTRVQREFDETFAYALSASPQPQKSILEALILQSHSFLTLIQKRNRPLDPVIARIQNICNLALEHQAPSSPPPAKPTLQRSSSSGSPSLSTIARAMEGVSIPINLSQYDQWLTTLKQSPPSENLQEDIIELDGTLAYCLVSQRTVDERIQDLNKISLAIASQPNPHLQRIDKICKRAIEILKNPTPAPTIIEPELDIGSQELNTSSWHLPRIATVTTLAISSVSLLFIGYKYRAQLLQKSLQIISWVKSNFSQVFRRT